MAQILLKKRDWQKGKQENFQESQVLQQNMVF